MKLTEKYYAIRVGDSKSAHFMQNSNGVPMLFLDRMFATDAAKGKPDCHVVVVEVREVK